MADRRVRLILEAQVDNFNARMRQARDSADGLGGSLRQAVNQPEVQALGRTLTAFGAVTVGALGAAAKAAMDWESAWADVNRRTEGTPQQLSQLEDGLRGLAREMPATHAEIAEVAASAAQLGVSVNDVEDFTETMVMMGATTDMSADQAATAMARFANVMGTSHSDFDNLGSAIVDLGNNSATTESEIMNMAQRIAGAGNAMGMSEGEVLGFAAALSSVGIQAAAGGTAISRTMYDIDGAVSQGGEALEGFAEIAGMSADEFSRLWADDAASGMEAFISGLGRIQEEGGSVAQALEEVGITEVRTVAAMTQMASAGDMLGESLERGNQAFGENSAMAAEYAYIQETVAAQLQVFWNRVKDAAIDVGAFALPILERLINWAGDAVTWFGNLPGPVQAAVAGLTGLAGAASLLLGSAILLAPSLMATGTALGVIAPAGGRARAALGGISRAAGIAAVAFAGFQAALAVARATQTDFAFSTEEAERQIRYAAASSEGFNSTAVDFEGNLGGLGRGFDTLGEAIERGMSNNWGDRAAGWAAETLGLNNSITAGREVIAGFDQQLASMISDGNIDGTIEAFLHLKDEAEAAGVPMVNLAHREMPALSSALHEAGTNMDEFMNALGLQNGYVDAATGKWIEGEISLNDLKNRMSETEQEALAAALGVDDLDDSLDAMGEEALTASEAMRQLVDSLVEAGMLTRDVRGAARDYEAALDELTDSLNTNGATLDTTTEAGRRNEAALDGIADAGVRSMQAMADNGASQDELQGKLQRTHDDLVTAAQRFGLTEDQARELTREILGIPEGVDIDSWMSDEAKRMAEETSAALDRVDGRHTRSSHTHSITTREMRVSHGVVQNQSAGGITFSTGGSVRGPGTGTSDDIPAWLSNGEHVLTAREVALMGGQSAVYDFRAGLTGSTPQRPSGSQMMPTYSGGGAVQAQQLSEALRASISGAGGGGLHIGEIKAIGGDTTQVVNRVGDEIFRRLRQEGVPVGSF